MAEMNVTNGNYTVRDEIYSKLEISGSVVKPKRTEAETQSAMRARNVLDQEYNGLSSKTDYRTLSLDEVAGRGVELERSEAEAKDNLIGHTDAIRFDGVKYTVVVTKSTTETLNTLEEGKYMQTQFLVDFQRSDAASLESRMRDFVPRHADLPRARISTKLEDGMIVVEPNLNGFKITVLTEILDDLSFKELDALNYWVENYQGYILEMTLNLLKTKGVDVWDMVRSQATVGLIPRARRLYEQKMARNEAAPGATPVITKNIRDNSATFADELNDTLNLIPLTGSTLHVGTQVSVIEVTTDAAIISEWKSARGNFSYFAKGTVTGRINRISGSYRSIPILSDMEEGVAEDIKKLIPYVLTVFENTARRQLGIDTLADVSLPAEKKPATKNIQELFNLDPVEILKIENEYTAKVDEFIRSHFADEQTKNIASVLTLLARGRDKEV